MNVARPFFAGLLLLAVSGCALSGDPYEPARAAAAAGRVTEAYALLAAGPVHELRSHRLRAELEQRIEDGHQRVLRGIELLCEQRHDRALALFETALAVCPDDPYAARLLEATRVRLQAVAEAEPPVPPAPLADSGGLNRGARASALREVELLLQQGLGDRALSRLDQLHASSPDDTEVARELARVLNQQALLRYGQGKLPQAITYWKRVLELQPDIEDARRYLQLAEREQASR